MKSSQKEPVVKPLLKQLKKQERADAKKNEQPSVGSQPLQPADLYQDAGQGYNEDFTFPQE